VAPLVLVAVASALAACGSDDAAGGDRPTIVVTTGVWGDVVESMFGDAADVTVLVPTGASPHEFQASARQAAELRDADLVVANGGGFEAGLVDVLAAAASDGVTVHEAISTVATLRYGETSGDHGPEHDHDDGHDDHDDGHDDHADEDGDGHEGEAGDDHDHDHDGVDPHITTDPARVAAAARGILDAIVREVPELDTEAVRTRATAYLAELDAVDAEVEAVLASIPDDRRVLVTNHESLGYFADRYGFELVGAVIPSTSTADASNARDLADLEAVIEAEGVPAIFADTSSPAALAERLAADAGGVEVVALYTEALGDAGSGADTYLGMVRTNAERIATALG